MIHWGTLPRHAHATFYLPEVDTEAILAAAGMQPGATNLAAAGDHTISCKVSDVSFVPIPGNRTTAIPGLLTLQMPPGVSTGERFSVVVRQVEGRSGRVVGTFQFDVVVAGAEQILPRLVRDLSVLRHILLGIPEANRWYATFKRYVDQVADRIRAFGEEPDRIGPSSTGNGSSERPGPGAPDGEAAATGKVTRLLYDCFGDFEGFVIEHCGSAHRFQEVECSLERVVRHACERRQTVTVISHPGDRDRPLRLVVHCC